LQSAAVPAERAVLEALLPKLRTIFVPKIRIYLNHEDRFSFRMRKHPQLLDLSKKLHSTQWKLHHGFAITALCDLGAKSAQE
jgi:hypothetical protein